MGFLRRRFSEPGTFLPALGNFVTEASPLKNQAKIQNGEAASEFSKGNRLKPWVVVASDKWKATGKLELAYPNREGSVSHQIKIDEV